ncbi:MAG: DUF368 domain-containing protein [Parachlamydiales bacterium]|jgi:putative membrane protein
MSRPRATIGAFLSGMCIGAADLVPGISGGTVALILGMYGAIINGLRSIDGDFFKLLFRGQFKDASVLVPLGFLGAVVGGMLFSIATLVHVIKAILADPVYKPMLYALFLGLVLASAVLIFRRIQNFKPIYLLWGLLAAGAAFYLSGLELPKQAITSSYSAVVDLWAFFCGMLGICAMLLPGISGGYLLNVLGMYGNIIDALSTFIHGIVHFHMEWAAFFLLLNLGLGVLIGAIVFSRAISWALTNYHDLTISVLVGFMLGALRSVWPFINDINEPFLPPFTEPLLWSAVALTILGFTAVSTAHNLALKAKANV